MHQYNTHHMVFSLPAEEITEQHPINHHTGQRPHVKCLCDGEAQEEFWCSVGWKRKG